MVQFNFNMLYNSRLWFKTLKIVSWSYILVQFRYSRWICIATRQFDFNMLYNSTCNMLYNSRLSRFKKRSSMELHFCSIPVEFVRVFFSGVLLYSRSQIIVSMSKRITRVNGIRRSYFVRFYSVTEINTTII